MSSTSVHLPSILVDHLDRVASRERTSRNRLIVQACEEFLSRRGGRWPAGCFDEATRSAEDLSELRTAGQELERSIYAARSNRAISEL